MVIKIIQPAQSVKSYRQILYATAGGVGGNGLRAQGIAGLVSDVLQVCSRGSWNTNRTPPGGWGRLRLISKSARQVVLPDWVPPKMAV